MLSSKISRYIDAAIFVWLLTLLGLTVYMLAR